LAKIKPKITGKYLFFSESKEELEKIAIYELENEGFYHAKIMVLSKSIYTKTKQQNMWAESESTKLQNAYQQKNSTKGSRGSKRIQEFSKDYTL